MKTPEQIKERIQELEEKVRSLREAKGIGNVILIGSLSTEIIALRWVLEKEGE